MSLRCKRLLLIGEEYKYIMKKHTNIAWFTLIELIISIAIFGMIMISVIAIFLFSSQMSTRVELNRLMQENIKNVLEDIAENVRVWEIWEIDANDNRVKGVLEDGGTADCNAIWPTKVWTKLCLKGDIQYTIGYYDTTLWPGTWKRANSIQNDCQDNPITWTNLQTCHIIKSDGWGPYYPLTNSFVTFTDVKFIVTNTDATDIPRVTISMVVRPAIRKWLAPNLLKLNEVVIQTSISERLIETK